MLSSRAKDTRSAIEVAKSTSSMLNERCAPRCSWHTTPIVVPCDYIPRIQEVQASIYHTMREMLEVLAHA